jgi:DnaJ-class molecular chaperone
MTAGGTYIDIRLIERRVHMVIATDDLEITCPNCNGTGGKEEAPCEKCSGKGVILTAQGNTLLHFIKKHLNQ